MGAFLNGELRAMKACYETKEGVEEDTMPLPKEEDNVEGGSSYRVDFSTSTSASASVLSSSSKQQYPSQQLQTSEDGNRYYGGAIRVIRPLVYVREHETREFARNIHLPVINENCPACFEAPKERRRVKKLLAQQESLFPATFKHLRRAMIPLMSANATRNLQDYAADRLQSGRVKWSVNPRGSKVGGENGDGGSSAKESNSSSSNSSNSFFM
jgi:hypothetical protein